ncbi:MAG: hypothetical protein GY708_24900 [Actinomycetia bacterium]|nr:hypothetical protein [Actinomycetes bacterium]
MSTRQGSLRALALVFAVTVIPAAAGTPMQTSPGAVPDGATIHGNPLLIERAEAGAITLTWGGSCQPADDFAVYEGTLGSFASNEPTTCSTGGLAQETLTPGAGNRYYLVVPLQAGNEGSYGLTSGQLERPVGATVCHPQFLGNPTCPPAGRWTDPATWGGAVPLPGNDVTIRAGMIVVLDDDVVVQELQIDGELHCTNEDASISAESILVAGRFKCGSASSPFVHDLEITLVGVQDAGSEFGMGNKLLGVLAGGSLELHGEPRVSWTQLDATAAQGSSALTVASAVDWRAGEQIIVAPTHEAYDEGEVRVVAGVTPDGLQIQLAQPLDHTHYGEQSTYVNGVHSWTLDERAEVGLLTRNITIQGDKSSTDTGFGGHLMIMSGAMANVSGVELFRMGQKALMARYPFHWHLAGSVVGQYITNSSIHRSFNRCVTVHGTHDALVADNVCYDFVGHGYFLEDGIEQNNVFDHNLGVWARKPIEGEELLPTDIRDALASNGPAVFWIGNPTNTFTNNAAAGSEGTGYWYGMVDHVTGPSAAANPGYNPQTAPAGPFVNNRVHSSRQGFSSCQDESGAPGYNPPEGTVFEGLTVNHTVQGIWPCTPLQTAMKMTFLDTIVANTQNGMQSPNPVAMVDSAFVAYTANAPTTALPGFESNWRAVQVYDQGFLFDNVHFVNYDGPAMTAFYPGGGAHKHSSNRAQGLSFANSPHLLLDLNETQVDARPTDWGDVVHDLDGSFVGANHAVVADHPLMYDHTCVKPTSLKISGYACPYRYAHFRAEHFADDSPMTILRSDGHSNTSGHVDWGFINEFILDPSYLYTYRYEDGMRHKVVQVHLRNAFAGDTAVYELLDVPSTYGILTGGWTEADDVSDVLDGAGRRYKYRDGSLFLKMLAGGEAWHATDIVDVCMTQTGCGYGAPHDVGTLPTVQITSPADGARFPVGSDIQLTANVSDPDGIASARLYLNLELVGEVLGPTFQWTLPDVQEGNHTLKLVAEDLTGTTFTAVQQLFVGEAVPRIEITAPLKVHTAPLGGSAEVSFDVHNWTVAPGDDHVEVFVNGASQGPIYSSPISVAILNQGRHAITLALAEADGTVRAVDGRITAYGMLGGLLADFEDGVDLRSSLTPEQKVDVTNIKFAWGTSDPVGSRQDGEDDINYFDIYNNDDGRLGFATYRLEIFPPQDWTAFEQLQVKSDGLTFEMYVVDATEGASYLGDRTGNLTTHPLPTGDAVDEVVAVELRYSEATVPALDFVRQHLYYIRLLDP